MHDWCLEPGSMALFYKDFPIFRGDVVRIVNKNSPVGLLCLGDYLTA